MKKIIHLSDLHFGRIEEKRIKPLQELIKKINPDMVVISGDFTQRATEKEYIQAHDFIQSLSFPVFVVPGNHDVPLYNVLKRFYNPYKNYKKYISLDLSPFYYDQEVALIGINSARSVAISSGKITTTQIQKIESNLKDLDPGLVKIVVCHHPLDLPSTKKTHHNYTHGVVGQSKMAMDRLSKLGVDVYLTGHLHVHHIGDTSLRYNIEGYNALIIQAGTALSTRMRGEPVSFNVLHVDKKNIRIEHFEGDRTYDYYNLNTTEKFSFTETGWKKSN